MKKNIRDLSNLEQNYLIGKAEHKDVFIKNNSCWIWKSRFDDIKSYYPHIKSIVTNNGISVDCVLSKNILKNHKWTAHIENKFSYTCTIYEDAVKLCFIASKFGDEVCVDSM